jgi:arylsulfatase A-like enzyme
LGFLKNFRATRKDASIVNQEFLDWLSRRNEPDRPFFAFLNYWDAHHPYLVPGENARHFGLIPETAADTDILTAPMDKQRLSERGARLLCDSYDDCIAYVDKQLGLLLEQLTRRGLLDRTIIIITSDHGESMGEHDLFGHGLTLYRPEIHVPLLLLGTTRLPESRVVTNPVSLRDLPATIVDLLGIKETTQFPGVSLTRYWKPVISTHSPLPGNLPLAELDSPQPGDVQRSRSPAFGGPLASIMTPDLLYICGLRSGREELYRWREDPLEARNLADSRDSKSALGTLRKEVSDLVSPKLNLDPR